MKCHKHNDKDAVGTCIDCWVWLCSECSQEFSLPICKNCNIKRFEKESELITNNIHKYVWIWLMVIVIWIILLFANTSYLSYPRNEMILFFAQYFLILYCLIFIWFWLDFLNWLKDTNTITIKINEPLFVVIARKIIKLAIAWIIWWVMWPYQLYKMKKRMKEIDIALLNLKQ